MAGLSRILLFAAVLVSTLDVLENLQNDLSGAIVRGHLTDNDRSRLLEINGALAVNLGRQRNKKPVDEKELKSAMKEIGRLLKKGDFDRADAVRIDVDLDNLKHRLSHR